VGIYDKLGVKKIINGAGTLTNLGGSLMEPQTIEAMSEAATSFVYMEELIKRAGEVIAEATGAEAGLVTAGGAAALALSVAACMTGKDPQLVSRLPDTTGMKDEVIVQRLHRNRYDRCVRIPGARLVEVGDESGTRIEEFRSAIGKKTAAIVHFVFDPQEGVLPIEKVIEIGRTHKVPVIVDAAAELPPAENLRKFVAMGADLVIFSGGKGILGPNDSGLLCGKKDLVDAAYLNAFPNSEGIGRAMKISKEQVAGLVVALRRYVLRDHEKDMKRWTRMADEMVLQLNAIRHVSAKVTRATGRVRPLCIPRVEVRLDKELGVSVPELVNRLKEGNPAVVVLSVDDETAFQINPQCLSESEPDLVVRRIKDILLKGGG